MHARQEAFRALFQISMQPAWKACWLLCLVFTLGCGEAPEPAVSQQKPTTGQGDVVAPSTKTPAADTPSTATRQVDPSADPSGQAAPAQRTARADRYETRLDPPADAPPADAPDSAAEPFAAQPSAAPPATAATPHETDAGESPAVERPIAATAREALELIDLRQLPRLPEAKSSVETPAQVSMSAPGDVAEARRFYTDQLQNDGWRLVPVAPGAESADYAQLNFTKQGFQLGVSIYGAPGANQLTIGLDQYGNIDARDLPAPPESEPMYQGFNTAMYVTSAGVPETAVATIDALAARGWRLYAQPHTAYVEDARQRSLNFLQNGVGLTAFIAFAPAQQNRTTVQYSVHMLGDELPIPPHAEQIAFQVAPLQLTCDTPDPLLATLDFFRSELTALGWQEKGTDLQVAGHAVSVFHRDEGLPIMLKLSRKEEDAPTSVSIAAFRLPKEIPADNVAQEPMPPTALPDLDLKGIDLKGLDLKGVDLAKPAGGATGGILSYEAWLKKNDYEASVERLQQYAKEVEQMTRQLGDSLQNPLPGGAKKPSPETTPAE